MSPIRGNAPLVLTMGEPAGIGPDIAIEAWLARHSEDVSPFCFVGPENLVRRRAAVLGKDIATCSTTATDAFETFNSQFPCLSGFDDVHETRGKPDSSTAKAVINSIEMATRLVKAGHASAVVTNPIQKSTLTESGFKHPGHTEFLGELSHSVFNAASANPIMMLASPRLRVIPVTVHQPLRSVAESLSWDRIIQAGLIASRDLHDRFGLENPRLAVLGLNPHAGEDGTMGHEEQDVILPAIEELRRLGVDARGPFPADTMFHEAARDSYDVVLCMYHDQALIPVKTLDFDKAVNVTLGLPFIRTSPDHGTALSLAGTGQAKADSLIAALNLAAALADPKRPKHESRA